MNTTLFAHCSGAKGKVRKNLEPACAMHNATFFVDLRFYIKLSDF